MNRFVLIAVGGTGMRIAQSVVMLAASGALTDLAGTDDYELEIKMVDLDIVPEGDKDELTKLIEDYNQAVKHFAVDKGAIWKPHAISVGSEEQNLFKLNDQTLGKKLGVLIDDKASADVKALLQALYSEEERNAMTLDYGCNGKPRIGSLLLATAFEEQKVFWNDIVSKAPTNDGMFRVMFAGSVFGGTGASGVPTLARKFIGNLDEQQGKIFKHVGLTLMLPYFTYQKDTNDPVDPFLFPLQSQMAIKYYADSDAIKEEDGVEFVQVLGDDSISMDVIQKGMEEKTHGDIWMNMQSCFKRDEKTGAKGQDNPSMPVELMAALGICRFFAGGTGSSSFDLPSKNTAGIAAVGTRIKNFGYFSTVIPMEEYVGRLARLYLMLKVYLPGRQLDQNGVETYDYDPPLGIKQQFRKLKDYQNAIIAVNPFLFDIFCWLRELNKHGMEECIQLNQAMESSIECAAKGETRFELYHIYCSEMLRGLNNMLPGEFFKTILSACTGSVYENKPVASAKTTH